MSAAQPEDAIPAPGGQPHALESTISEVVRRLYLDAFEGSWTLLDLGDGRTRAQYAVTIDFGRELGLLLRGPAGKALRGAARRSARCPRSSRHS